MNTSDISIEFRHHQLRHLQYCVVIACLYSCLEGLHQGCWRRPVSCTPLPAGLHDVVPVRRRSREALGMRSTNAKFYYSQVISYLKCLETFSFYASYEVLSMTLWNLQPRNNVGGQRHAVICQEVNWQYGKREKDCLVFPFETALWKKKALNIKRNYVFTKRNIMP